MPTYNLPPGCTPEMALIVLREQDRRRTAWEAEVQASKTKQAKMEFEAEQAKMEIERRRQADTLARPITPSPTESTSGLTSNSVQSSLPPPTPDTIRRIAPRLTREQARELQRRIEERSGGGLSW